MTDLLIPLLCAGLGLCMVLGGKDVYTPFRQGTVTGLETLLGIFSALLFFLPAISVLRASGLLDALTAILAPLLIPVGIPSELAPLLLLRPFSGSGALAMGTALITAHGADSVVGRTAAVMLGSTETTFYVLTVYFAGLNQKAPHRILPCALLADLVGFIAAAATVRFFFGT